MEDTIDKKTNQAAELLKALAHPIRMQIVMHLTEQASINVGSLQNLLNIEQSLLSHHLIKMNDQGILHHTRKGKEIYYSIADPTVIEITKLMVGSRLIPKG
ncbi:metalloregulator ArsR/SmtB family transcription factor [Spirosoma sp. KNUC1025]|uniref:ArsR/SmtB family transcription factor n=1 Tax=Spirosoma sp. KNUC1025 TaxID=2894082 RepID=UPI0038663012|nr:metalloregulator ArsR/SmtB family transcription factor [Spirosoma sp. KNUC1025]